MSPPAHETLRRQRRCVGHQSGDDEQTPIILRREKAREECKDPFSQIEVDHGRASGAASQYEACDESRERKYPKDEASGNVAL